MTTTIEQPGGIKLYRRRWLLMAVFMFFTISNGLPWIEFSSISNIIARYYGISETWVEWTTLSFMVSYVVFVFPSVYILDRIGLKNSLILVAITESIGRIIKAFSVSRDRFFILMIGQILEAVCSAFTFAFVGRFTACWFGSKEISRAGALTLLGDQFGSAFSFLIPSLMVRDSSDIEKVEQGMMKLHVTFAVVAVLTLILIACLFQEKPKLPPSFAQVKQSENEGSVWKSIFYIFSKPSFLLLSFSYGLTCTTNNIVSTFLNQLISRNLPELTQDAGKVGFVCMISGMISSIVASHVLDKTRYFKANAIVSPLCTLVSLIIFAVALKLGNSTLVYVSSGILGFCFLGYYATGIQMGIELTYPISEGIVTSSMFLFAQLVSVGLTSVYGFVLKQYDDVVANIGLMCVLVLSIALACSIPADFKRENVENAGAVHELTEFISKT